MSPEDEEGEEAPYNVGYKKPPFETRFKPGNKAGAGKRGPRRNKQVNDLLQKISKEKVDVTINGKRVRMTLLEAIVRDLFFNGKKAPKDTMRLLELIQQGEALQQSDVQPALITVEFVNTRPKGIPSIGFPKDRVMPPLDESDE